MLIQTAPLNDYLQSSEFIDIENPLIQDYLKLHRRKQDTIAVAEEMFRFVRDEISHSWDIKSHRVTSRASEVLRYKEGICYAKSHLLAALLRGAGIPSGICYQRLTLGDTPDTGYVVHALNTVYIAKIERWIRIDARGNKQGVDAQFSIGKELLAFPIRPEHDERDYLLNFANPHPKIIATLTNNNDCLEMCEHRLPTELNFFPSSEMRDYKHDHAGR
jgi:transglutaminase-like putative cysteine protease